MFSFESFLARLPIHVQLVLLQDHFATEKAQLLTMANSTLWEGAGSTTQYPVYLGTWTNWSRGRVMGATLTTTRQYGNLFIAFTAFFVGFVASRFWKMAWLVIQFYLPCINLMPKGGFYRANIKCDAAWHPTDTTHLSIKKMHSTINARPCCEIPVAHSKAY